MLKTVRAGQRSGLIDFRRKRIAAGTSNERRRAPAGITPSVIFPGAALQVKSLSASTGATSSTRPAAEKHGTPAIHKVPFCSDAWRTAADATSSDRANQERIH